MIVLFVSPTIKIAKELNWAEEIKQAAAKWVSTPFYPGYSAIKKTLSTKNTPPIIQRL